MKFFKTNKKLKATIFGVISVILVEYFGLDEATSIKIVALVSSYVVGQGFADVGKEAAKKLEELD